MSEKLPAHLEGESVIIASIFRDGVPSLEEALRAGLEPTDLYDERNRLIYLAQIWCASNGKPPDEIRVKMRLEETGQLETVGPGYLISRTDGVPARVNLPFHVAEILRTARIRKLVCSLNQTLSVAMERSNGDLDKALQDHRNLLANLDRKAGHAKPRGFEQIAEDRYRLTIPDVGLSFEVDRLRRESSELIGELCVRCALPGIPTYDGNLSIADFNLSSARARSERARLLTTRSNGAELDWAGFLEELCQRTLAAERNGQPAVDLRDLPRPEPDDALDVDGLRFPRRHATCMYGDGGAAKSYTGLFTGGRLVRQGLSVALFDWELAGEDHRDRLERLFGDSMPKITYARCERPLVHEVDRLRRIVRDEGIEYAIFDSVAFACDGPPESAEVASRYFRAVRQIGVGSLHIAHVTKSEGGEEKPFGSVFWHNGARSTWYVKLTDESQDGQTLTLGLFNKKANLGRLLQPVGFRIQFTEDRTCFTRTDPADTPDLAEKMTIRQRMIHLLKDGALSIEQVAEELAKDPDTIRKTAVRHKTVFKIFSGGKVALLERDTESGQFVRRTLYDRVSGE